MATATKNTKALSIRLELPVYNEIVSLLEAQTGISYEDQLLQPVNETTPEILQMQNDLKELRSKLKKGILAPEEQAKLEDYVDRLQQTIYRKLNLNEEGQQKRLGRSSGISEWLRAAVYEKLKMDRQDPHLRQSEERKGKAFRDGEFTDKV